jgi:hypothetical protein
MQVRLVPKHGLGAGPGGLIDALAPAAKPRTLKAVAATIASRFFTVLTSFARSEERSYPLRLVVINRTTVARHRGAA